MSGTGRLQLALRPKTESNKRVTAETSWGRIPRQPPDFGTTQHSAGKTGSLSNLTVRVILKLRTRTRAPNPVLEADLHFTQASGIADSSIDPRMRSRDRI
jgi:hypothetical protein